MRYHDTDEARELASRAREFVDEVVIPTERDQLGNGPPTDEDIGDLRAAARERDVYCPQISTAYGGMGLGFRDALPLFEEAGRSLLGPSAMRVDAPDEGNMHTLELVGTEEQKRKYLAPLVAGEIRSGFAMTEPREGGGSDPKMLSTTAELEGDEYVINGHKWWTTQGRNADVLFTMAITNTDVHPYNGASIVLVPSDADGLEFVRDIPHLGPNLDGHGHAEFRFDNVRVPRENLIGDEHAGFTIAQQRLGPARLTHCMRFSGMATRALNIAKAYMTDRTAFGTSLSNKQSLRYEIADAETRLHGVRTMVRHAAAEIARGEEARVPVSMSKVFAANVAQDAIDLSIQCCGGAGMTRDLPLADFYEAVRAFRLVDGADEVHKRVIARHAFDGATDRLGELENLPTF